MAFSGFVDCIVGQKASLDKQKVSDHLWVCHQCSSTTPTGHTYMQIKDFESPSVRSDHLRILMYEIDSTDCRKFFVY